MNVYLTSLGCDKNLVDGEVMLDILAGAGHEIVGDGAEADVVIVNTCSFIKSATEESIETVLELSGSKKKNRHARLIVTGCMAERYGAEIFNELPEVDAVAGTRDYESIADIVDRLAGGETNISELSGKNTGLRRGRLLCVPNHSASLKIAEGCDNRCTYCVIPRLRGGYVSRDMEGLIREARSLAETGTTEIALVAQDTTMYGTDLYGERRLPELINKLSEIDGVGWIRVLYAYPERVTPALIDTIANNPKVCDYIDMPVQHADDGILKHMNRRTTRASLEETIDQLREKIPDICIRSTVMTGFPGESEEAFENLLSFIKKIKFDRLGAFAYSREEGTPAYKLPGQLSAKIKNRRKDECLKIQREISRVKMKDAVGKELRVIVDGRLADENIYCGRSYMDSPGVDGTVFFPSGPELISGSFVNLKITGSSDYDLYGELIGCRRPSDPAPCAQAL